MKIRLKKTLTWTLFGICFVILTFNFYNRSIWLPAELPAHIARNLADNVHKPKLPYITTIRAMVSYNVTTEANKLNKVAKQMSDLVPKFKLEQEANKQVLWPGKEFYDNDRITNQLKFKPQWLTDKEAAGEEIKLKKILLYTGMGGWAVKRGQHTFIDQKCAINTCEIVDNREMATTADAVLFHHSPQRQWTTRPANQIWILFLLESPYHTPGLGGYSNVFNWTATYRHDSDIVAPYEKFVPFDDNVRVMPQNKSYAAGKTKKVAWFVSNCGARNKRKDYALKLANYIDVDIYGACGTLRCSRRDAKCFEMLNTDYKFYLAFENSNCRDYITEKFFVTGLQHDVIPIVMGGAPEDYVRAAPPHSFIHVDDFESAEELAKYLHKLDQNDDLYNEYFRWRGTGSFINTFFWCRICGMLHDTSRESHVYRDLEKWWRGGDVCIGEKTWREHQRTSKFIADDYLL